MLARSRGWLAAPSVVSLLVCVLAGCQHSARERLASFRDIQVADLSVSTRGQRVRDSAIVTYSDPEWRLLFLQDDSGGVYLEPPTNPVLKAGDRVLITGTTTVSSKLLDRAEYSILSSGPMPQPVALKNASELANFPSRYVQLAGTVRWAGIRAGRATLEVFAGDRSVRVLVFPGTSEDLPRIGSEIRIAGVSATDNDKGEAEALQLLTPSVRAIQVRKAGPVDPFALPLTKASDLKNVAFGSLVRLSGRMVDRAEGLLYENGPISIPVNMRKPVHGDFAAAELAGFWTGRSLDDAMIRPVGELLSRTGDIRTLSELKHLTVAEASTHRRVSVKGVVTYWDPYWHLLFVQDGTDAAFVKAKAPGLPFRAGDVVDVSGVANQGDFAPTVAEATVSFVRRGGFPEPLKLDLVESNLAEADSRWCNLRGVVHAAKVVDGHTTLKLGAGETAANIQLPTLIKGDELIDKEVSATGALGILFNERRQAVGHQIFVPAPEFLTVVNGGGKPNPPAAIIALRRYSPRFDEHHSAHIRGTVVLKAAEHTIFVQDKTAGIQVRLLGLEDVSDGDQVSVQGFLLPGEYSPVLEDAAVSRESSGELPDAEQITAKSALEGLHDSQYVSIAGTLSGIRPARNGLTLVLNEGGSSFDAIGPAGAQLASLRLGSRLAVRGICRISLDRSSLPYSIRGFTLAFDSPASVIVLKNGPWWDAHKVGWAVLLFGIFASTAALWATILRQQVHAKTQELRLSLNAKRKAQQFDIARNEVLEGIARNAPLPESMERLALAIEEQVPGSTCAIVMPADGRSFWDGRPSPVLIAPGIREELHTDILPILASALQPSEVGFHRGVTSPDPDLLGALVAILRHSGMAVATGQITIVFSASGIAEGLLVLFLKEVLPAGEGSCQAVLQSAARLVSLARDHWYMHDRLLHEARHDGLTGLPNRTVAEDRLEQALARASRRRKLFAVLCIDLDGFKEINDELGHDSGDQLLRIVSSRLKARTRHSDTLARMGGDEFLAVIEDCSGDSAAQSVAQMLLSSLQEPLALEGRQLKISASVGIAMYPADGVNASQLRRNADQAMYRAKGRGGNQTCFWSGEPALAGKAAQKSTSTT